MWTRLAETAKKAVENFNPISLLPNLDSLPEREEVLQSRVRNPEGLDFTYVTERIIGIFFFFTLFNVICKHIISDFWESK